jgi:hypothetical protein
MGRERPFGLLLVQSHTGLWSAGISVGVVAWLLNVFLYHFFNSRAIRFTPRGALAAVDWTLTAVALGITAYSLATLRPWSRLLAVCVLPGTNVISLMRIVLAGGVVHPNPIGIGWIVVVTASAWWYFYKRPRVVDWYQRLASTPCTACAE